MLEVKIEELTKAITTLTEFLQGQDLKQEIAELESPTNADSNNETSTHKTLTHDDLKAACLKVSREDIKNKPKVKSLLKEYEASKAVDVPEDKLEEVIARIEKGDF